jgi:hypothetical protein
MKTARLVAAVAALITLQAQAAERTLYIKNRGTKLKATASLTGKDVAELGAGTAVTWKGADAKNKQFHKVTSPAGEGFTLQQNLSVHAPGKEYLQADPNSPVDLSVATSSGAATRALSGAGLKYAEQKASPEQVTKGLMTAEGVAAQVTPEASQELLQKLSGGAK